MQTGSRLHYVFHQYLLCPDGWAELIHSACVLFMGLHVSLCVSRGSGGSSVQHVPGKFVITSVKSGREREKSSKKVGKSRDRWRNIGVGWAIKREGKRGNFRNTGGIYRVKKGGWKSPGVDVRKLSLLGLAPSTKILACIHWTCLLCACPIYHSVPSTFSPLCCFVSHPSLGSTESSTEPSPDTLIIWIWISIC